jgi:hypothetical protein
MASCRECGGIDYPLGDTERRSVEGGGIQTGGWLACLSVITAMRFIGL